MELEKAIKYLDMMNNKINFELEGYVCGKEAIETVLQELKNSILKKKIEDKIDEYKKIKEDMEQKDIGNGGTLEITYTKILGKIEGFEELLEDK